MSKLEISEVFISFQGEGPLTGRKAIFLRLARCNLRCIWCDTKYAYEPRYILPIHDVAKILLKYREGIRLKRPLLVITGGEPLLQKSALKELLKRIRNMFSIQIETNGTIDISDMIELFDYVIVSPKLSNSGNPYYLRRISPTYAELIRCFRDKIYFKFVIDKREDIYEVENIVNTFNIPRENVYLMPQCRSFNEHMSKLRLVYELALRYDYSISIRLQYLLGIR